MEQMRKTSSKLPGPPGNLNYLQGCESPHPELPTLWGMGDQNQNGRIKIRESLQGTKGNTASKYYTHPRKLEGTIIQGYLKIKVRIFG